MLVDICLGSKPITGDAEAGGQHEVECETTKLIT